MIYINGIASNLKSTTTTCLNPYEAVRTKDKRRVKMYHEATYYWVIDDYNGVYLTYVRYYNKVTAYKKVLGIWFTYKTIIAAELDVDWRYQIGYTWYALSEYDYHPYAEPEVRKLEYSHAQIVAYQLISPYVIIYTSDSWAYTRGTTHNYKATIICN